MFSFLRFEWTKKKRFAAQTLSVKYFRLICVFGQMNYTKLIFFSKSKSDKWQTQLAFHSNKNCCFLLIFFFDAIPQLMFSWAAFLCFVFPKLCYFRHLCMQTPLTHCSDKISTSRREKNIQTDHIFYAYRSFALSHCLVSCLCL